MLGSSPDLHHKDPGSSQSCSAKLSDENSGKIFSQSPWGSSVSPQSDSSGQQDIDLEEEMEN